MMKSPKFLNISKNLGRTNRLPLALLIRIQEQVQKASQNFINQILHPPPNRMLSLSVSKPKKNKMDDMESLSNVCDNSGVREESSQEETVSGGSVLKKDASASPESKHIVKRKRTRTDSTKSGDDPQAPKRKPPNYFVGVQITDEKIRSVAGHIQEEILKASELDISSTRVDPVKFHITLMVMHLPDEEAVHRAEETLEKLGPILSAKLENREVVLEFKGLATFGGGRVVFSPPQPSEALDDLYMIAEKVQQQMKENGIDSTDGPSKQFNPHLTLFKINYRDSKELINKGFKKIDETLYSPYKEEHLGFQKFSSLQLCSMGEPKQEDGYYFVQREVLWQQPKT